MNIYIWTFLIGMIIFTLFPFLNKNYRRRSAYIKALASIIIVLAIVLSVVLFKVNFVLALLIGLIIFILLDKRTYTKSRLIIYGLIIIIVTMLAFFLFRDNPDYIVNHLKENPTSSALYVAKDKQDYITYQSDDIQPLASTVKLLIAIEYALQVDEGKINKDSYVPLTELNHFYIKGTDGGGHEDWLKSLSATQDMNNEASLQDVVKGMITYSSNANTDYLINLLGINNINKRIKDLNLNKHDAIYPIVGALLIPYDDKDISPETLESMSDKEYASRAININEKLDRGEIQAENTKYTPSRKFEKIWSNRLMSSTAQDYGKLLQMIAYDEFPKTATKILHQIMEWPMEHNPNNKDRFEYLGGKGGSTKFVLTDAIYAKEHKQDSYELVLLFNDLNIWQNILLQNNLNSFESKFIHNEDYQLQVKETLTHTK
ncbi:MAG TPA: serine hydrolase [Pseudogracilibacillus sp.]|nr:serine hydrolase [Pseudogracilibacillus sp.]